MTFCVIQVRTAKNKATKRSKNRVTLNSRDMLGTSSSSSPMDNITESPDVVALLDKVDFLDLEKKCEKMKVCVTGSTSMVGSHIVRRLLRVGHVVHAPVRGP